MGRANEEWTPLPEGVGRATNVLLCAPSMEPTADEACAGLLSRGETDDECLLFVTLAESPDDRLATYRANNQAGEAEEVAFLSAGDSIRSAASEAEAVESAHGNTTIRTLSNPGDLTGLGMQTTELLSAWEGGDRSIEICFHSLTTLLQYVDTQQVFRFLHVFTERVGAANARAHYHIDPDAHDERAITTITPLFDAILKLEDGEWATTTP